MIRPLLAAILLLTTAPLSGKTPALSADQIGTRGLYLELIRQARADGRPRAAIAYLDDFDRQFPDDLDARLLRINSLLDLGQMDQAEAALAAANPRSADPTQAAGVAAAKGNLLAARGKWAEAIPFYQQAAQQNPTDPFYRNALGYALLRDHRTAQAIEALKNASDLAPNDATIRNNLMLAYAVDGRTEAMTALLGGAGDRKQQAELRGQLLSETIRIKAVAVPGATMPPAPANAKGY